MSHAPTCLAILLAVASLAAAQDASPPALPYTLPATMEHHRFFVEATTAKGDVLRLFTDTGGGMNLTTTGADKLGVPYTLPSNPAQEPAGTTAWPAYSGAWIPLPKSAGAEGFELPILVAPPGMTMDGMLGAAWFGDRTWEWDYRAGTLRLLRDGALPPVAPAHRVALGFQRDEAGARTTHFPRLPARIDGVELQFLFDTGATFRLDETAAVALGDAAVRERAGSFITRTVMDGWRTQHPDWPYLEQGDGKAAMIQVPDVEIAGFHTGPVWFSARPDSAFHEYMAQWMDRPVDGALGGNAFASFRVTVDYVEAAATFER